MVELSWASGRLVREYTFLLDPVELPRPTGAIVTTPGVSQVSPTVAPTVVGSVPSSKPVRAPKASSAPKAEAAPKAEPAPKSEIAAGGREVKRGDTLGKIASETAPDGVSLDQMLVAIFSANRDAFIGDNINRLKTGKILSIPDREAATVVSEGEARKTVAIHAQNFNAYRQKLAEAAASGAAVEAAPAQSASGKIMPKVEDKAPAPVAGKDKLEVSKSEAAKAGAKSAALAEEDKLARDKALKEAQARVAELEKNVADLKKLNEIKSQTLAAAAQKAEAAKTVPPAAPAKPESAKVAEAPKPTEPAKVEEPKPAEAAAVPSAEKPAEAAPPPPPKKKVVLPPEPEPEPTFMEEFGPFVYLGGALIALLGGFFGFREWKRRKSMDIDTSSQFSEASSTSSVFGTSGGQSVDTNNASLASGFSQTSLAGNEGTAGVDPVAEAEVYMAYGRDAQAEEILLEAIKAEPSRQAVHLKLLELYAARKSIKPFEEVARDLKQQTGGVGANWDKAAALGQGIDPGNPLYSGAPAPGEGPDDTGAFGSFGTSTVIMPPGQLAKMAAEGFDASKAETMIIDTTAMAQEAPLEETQSFDLDLGSPEPEPEVPAPAAAAEAVTLDFDLDLGAGAEPSADNEVAALDLEMPSISPAEAPAAPALDIEFDLELPSSAPAAGPELAAASPAAPAAGNGLDFDFNLDTPAAEPAASPVPEVGSLAPQVDFSAISLDLDAPSVAVEPAEAVAPAPAADEPDNPEVTTKLELAQAYEEMGDKEGMRELLQEVLAEGTAVQQELARSKLAEHGL